jgi:hypothetical protein
MNLYLGTMTLLFLKLLNVVSSWHDGSHRGTMNTMNIYTCTGFFTFSIKKSRHYSAEFSPHSQKRPKLIYYLPNLQFLHLQHFLLIYNLHKTIKIQTFLSTSPHPSTPYTKLEKTSRPQISPWHQKREHKLQPHPHHRNLEFQMI